MEKRPHILICDDQQMIHETIAMYLENEGFTHSSAYDGKEAVSKARLENPDLIILDIMMPGMSGTDACREIRRSSNVPIIMLTARDEEVDRVLNLEMGADDYVTKPFSPRELIARIKAILRRQANMGSAPSPVLRFPGLEINLNNYEILADGEKLQFTPKEVEILHLLASHPGQVFDRETILSKIWGYDYFGDMRSVDTQIKRIRQKLPKDARFGIKTVYGVGYKFEVQG